MAFVVLDIRLLHMCVWFDHPEDEDAHLTFDAEFFGYFFMWVAHAIAQYQHCHGVPDQTAPLTDAFDKSATTFLSFFFLGRCQFSQRQRASHNRAKKGQS